MDHTDFQSDDRLYGRNQGRPLSARRKELMQTLLPRLAVPDPAAGPFDPMAQFPAASEVWLEIGFGAGEHLCKQAQANPSVGLIGVEPFINGFAQALDKVDEAGITNIRLHHGDARHVAASLPDASIARAFILFPDPWPKARHHKRRLVSDRFALELARILKPGGKLRFATDWGDYGEQALEKILATGAFTQTPASASAPQTAPDDHMPTRYQLKALGDIAPVFLDFHKTPSTS